MHTPGQNALISGILDDVANAGQAAAAALAIHQLASTYAAQLDLYTLAALRFACGCKDVQPHYRDAARKAMAFYNEEPVGIALGWSREVEE